MPLPERGFLSEPFDHVRREVRRNHIGWHELLHKVNVAALAAQEQVSVHDGEVREKFGASLFARTIASSQAAVLLLEHGLVSQARCVLRSGLESLFALSAISRRPALVERLVETHKAEQQRVAKSVSLWKHLDLKEIAKAQFPQELLDEHLDVEANAISAFDLAQAGGLEDWYRTIYMTLSWSAHSAAIDLERHFVHDANGDLSEMRNEPETERQEVSWLMAIELLIKAVLALAGIFDSVNVVPINEYKTQLHALVAEAEG